MAAFPRIVEQATVDLYLERLRGWEVEPATQAVGTLVDTGKGWPTISELRDVYFRAHDRIGAYERQTAPDEAGVPPPPDVLVFMSRIGRHMPEVDLSALPRPPAGQHGFCDDCHRESDDLRMVGRRSFCPRHAESRLRVEAGLESVVPPVRDRIVDSDGLSAGGSQPQADEMGVSEHGRSPEPGDDAPVGSA